jgi:hypothetical protein
VLDHGAMMSNQWLSRSLQLAPCCRVSGAT